MQHIQSLHHLASVENDDLYADIDEMIIKLDMELDQK